MSKLNSKKRIFLAVSGLVVGLVVAWVWREWKEPTSGGPSSDSVFATFAKNRAYSMVPAAEDRAATRYTRENANSWFHVFAEPVQSLETYQSQNPTRPTKTRRTIVLQPIGNFNAEEKALLEDSKAYCEAFFMLPTRIEPAIKIDKSKFSTRASTFGASKTQMNSGELLGRVLEPNLPPDAAAYLGITMDDLWADGLAFVFGQATWHERVGVYSLARYFPKNRTRKLNPEERKIALRRTVQVLNHEAGHMFGIYHCTLYKCSMNGSNSLADSDASPMEYCPVCRRKLAWNIGFDQAKRDAKLQAFNRRFDLKE